jgi:hypothetical protein
MKAVATLTRRSVATGVRASRCQGNRRRTVEELTSGTLFINSPRVGGGSPARIEDSASQAPHGEGNSPEPQLLAVIHLVSVFIKSNFEHASHVDRNLRKCN